ncbi:hypothetical protein GEOBRER4_n1062 [Citrifermentans bremense]|uniref:Uncharacterized protein n=1 Tax=Citrifermentans bremense TaxID=60035 RepID=A0A6S6LWE5_9BACT|nr:hypothetical protein [Citrifermentans bremense]BCG46272.1 hypothetical protein GEOBRER4_n1062 [Citrifermentans bremense]
MTTPGAIVAGARRLAKTELRSTRLTSAACRLLLLASILLLAGCGDIVWFPPYVRLGTTPDQFTFAPKTGTDKGVPVTSEEITVSGLTADSSPISVTGSSGSDSKYSINGGAATSAPGTVKNNDKVKVSHTSAATLGTTTKTTLTIGNVSADFVSTTKNIEFSAPVEAGFYYRAQGTFTSEDTVPVVHTISIKDTANNGAQYAISDTDTVPIDSEFSNLSRTVLLNNRRIFVRNLIDSVKNGAITTLTIDGVDIKVNLTP